MWLLVLNENVLEVFVRTNPMPAEFCDISDTAGRGDNVNGAEIATDTNWVLKCNVRYWVVIIRKVSFFVKKKTLAYSSYVAKDVNTRAEQLRA